MRKRILSLLLTLTMVLQLCSTVVLAAEPYLLTWNIGDNGDNVTASLNQSTGVMTISGSGAIEDAWGLCHCSPYETYVKRIYIADGVTSIGDYSFAGYTNLTSVTIPDSMISIGYYAFQDCMALEEIIIPPSITEIGDYAFHMYDPDWDMYYPLSLTIYGESGSYAESYAENNYFSFESTNACGENLTWSLSEIPDEETGGTIYHLIISGNGAMYDYEYGRPWEAESEVITKIFLPEGLTSIGEYAFYNMHGVEEITIPAAVTSIGDYAFAYTNLSTMTLLGDEPVLGTAVFDGMYSSGNAVAYVPDNESWVTYDTQWGEHFTVSYESTESTNICGDNLTWSLSDDGILTISGSGAMYDYDLMNNLAPWDNEVVSQVVFDDNCTITSIGEHAFANCTQLTEIDIPDTVTEIDYGAFYGCTAITSVTLPENLETIDNMAFIMCTSLAEITIPAGVTSIGTRAFAYGGMTTVNMLGAEPVLGDDVFAGCSITTHASWKSPVSDQWGEIISQTPADQNPPEISLISPENGSSIRGETSFTVSASDDVGLSKIKMQRYGADVESHIVSGTSAAETFTIDTTDMEEGSTLTLYFIAVDTSDKQTEITCTFMVDNIDEPVDTTDPVITDVWPATEDGVTLCHNGTLQVAATDDVDLDRAEFYYEDTQIGTAEFNENGVASIEWNCAELAGEITLTYQVYDKAGNCAEETANITIRVYQAPAAPTNLTAEEGFRNAVLRWEYTGDLQTPKQFRVYACDANGGNAQLLTAVKSYKYTVRDLESGTQYFKVTAEDIYGAESDGAIISVVPETTEKIPPNAVIQSTELVGAVGTALQFSGVGSTDNDAIASYAWDFGDGSTGSGMVCEHTYQEAGSYMVKLTVTDASGNTNAAQTTITVYDISGEDAAHSLLVITVRDGFAEDTPVIEGATVQAEAEDYSYSALTDEHGCVSLLAPKGTVILTVLKDGYFISTQEVENNTTIYLRSVSVDIMDGEWTVEELTYDEIIEAGVDVSTPENQHIVKMETTIQTVAAPSMKGTDPILVDIPVSGLFNLNGDLVKGEGWGWNNYFIEDTEDDTQTTPPSDTPNDTPAVTKPALNIGTFPMGERYILVVYGEAHWLKEMYNVELLVLNNSYAENITNCTATLQLPDGLSLADMVDRVQRETVELGTIGHRGQNDLSSTASASWYVRGDAAGEYRLGAEVTGILGSTPFVQNFTTEDTVKVYAGEALHLTISAQNIAYKDEVYRVRYELENVSDKSLYNLQFGLSGAAQFQAVVGFCENQAGEWRRELSESDFEENGMIQVPEFKPGDILTIDFATDIWFNSAFEFADIGPIDVGYYVTGVVHTALEGSTTEIPYTINLIETGHGEVEKYMWKAIGEEIGGAVADSAVSLLDAVKFENEKVAENVVKAFQFTSKASDTADDVTGKDKTSSVVITLGEGASFGDLFVTLPQKEESIMPMSLRTATPAAPVVKVMTDAEPENCTLNEDGTMTIDGDARIFLQAVRAGEVPVTFTTFTEDGESYRENKYTYTCEVMGEAQTAEITHLALQGDDTIELDIPTEGTAAHTIHALLAAEDGSFYSHMAGEQWTVTGSSTVGVTVENGVLTVNSSAKAGNYTVKLTLGGGDGTAVSAEKKIVLRGEPEKQTYDVVFYDTDGITVLYTAEDVEEGTVPVYNGAVSITEDCINYAILLPELKRVDGTESTLKYTVDWTETGTSHAWDNGEVTTPSTCTAKGIKTYTCTHNAAHTKTEEIAVKPAAHEWDEGDVNTPSTCTEKGIKTYTCIHNAAHTKTEEIAVNPAAHEWDNGNVTTPSTCTEKGIKTYTCAHDAAHTKTEEIAVDPAAHEWDNGEVTTPSTCTAKGIKTYTCAHDAAHTKTEEIAVDPAAHEWDNGNVTTPSTCTEKGIKTYTCAHDAAHTKTEEIAVDPAAHEWGKVTYEWSADGKNCTAERICGRDETHIERADAVVAKAVKMPASCEKAGTTVYTASFTVDWASAQTMDVDDLPAIGHKDENRDHVCDNGCKELIGVCEDTDGDAYCDYGCGEFFRFTVTFEPNGGFCGTKTMLTGDNCTLQTLPRAERSRYIFLGWFTEKYSGTRITANTEFTEDTTVYAHWEFLFIPPIIPAVPSTPAAPPVIDEITQESGSTVTQDSMSAETVCDGGKNCCSTSFRDVDQTQWYHEAIDYVTAKGLMNGTGENSFSPEAELTRAMLVTILWRMEGEPVVDSLMTFEDVEFDTWYTEAIRWAAGIGIINGYGNGKFGTGNAVTREQAAAILHRYAVYKGLDNAMNHPMIHPMIPQNHYSLWAEKDILWADMIGLTDDIGGESFDMTVTASRAEIAAYLKAFCERFRK